MNDYWIRFVKMNDEVNDLVIKIEELKKCIDEEERLIKKHGNDLEFDDQIRIGNLYQELAELREKLEDKRKLL